MKLPVAHRQAAATSGISPEAAQDTWVTLRMDDLLAPNQEVETKGLTSL